MKREPRLFDVDERLKRLSHIGDQLEAYGRLSFMRFLGLDLTDKVPDAKTIWAFWERLNKCRRYHG
jgi:transposase, IS5 family